MAPKWLTVVALTIASSTGSAPSRIAPVDEGPRDPSFVRFRADLLSRVNQRDLKAVLRAFDPHVLITPGNRTGIAALQREWHVQRLPAGLFAELKSVFDLGGRFTDSDTFVAPYVFTDMPQPPDLKSLVDYAVVIKPNTQMFAEPNTSSRVIAVVNDEVFERNTGPQGCEYLFIPSGISGYVKDGTTRSPGDTHAVVTRTNGMWRISEFEAVIGG